MGARHPAPSTSPARSPSSSRDGRGAATALRAGLPAPGNRPYSSVMHDHLAVPASRRQPLRALTAALDGAKDVVLTTHVNADGDGAGSQAALAAWLLQRGKRVTIANPTGFPDRFAWILPDGVEVLDPGTEMDARVRAAGLVAVLDTGEPRRVGRLAKHLPEDRIIVLDHHPPAENGIPGAGVRDPSACATGELIYDLFVLDTDRDWTAAMIHGVYVAIETDTGSFRYSNTTPRAHAIAADLLRRGVDPEAVYRRIHATVPLQRIRMIRLALENLETDPELPITWISVPRAVTHEMGATPDDLDGVAEYARNVEGTEVAITFRETLDGATKVSFRSNGKTDVNAIAREFGGGGHVKAAGAVIGGPMETTRPRVLDAVRRAIRT
jgi:bifunctional oligoribonuclease and PAP phosphatase NrnA